MGLGAGGSFSVHQPAFDQFPFFDLVEPDHASTQKAHASARSTIRIRGGSETCREAICTYLRTARAVRCDPSQVMVVAGSQQALEITARVLLGNGSPVWIEEPGYRLARSVFQGAGGAPGSGSCGRRRHDCIRWNQPMRKGEGRLCYRLRNQFPLGSTMSAARRMQLLNWAQSAGSWIIEDDYDSEYRFESMPISSLQGLDRNARVIYIGTFSKVLFPSLRLGYLVIPPDLMDHFVAVRIAMDIFPPYLHQEVITDFMREGAFRPPHSPHAPALQRTKNSAGREYPRPIRVAVRGSRLASWHAF